MSAPSGKAEVRGEMAPDVGEFAFTPESLDQASRILGRYPEDVRVLHRRIPEFVGQVRHQLRSSPGTPRRNIVLDLSAVPPMPTAA